MKIKLEIMGSRYRQKLCDGWHWMENYISDHPGAYREAILCWLNRPSALEYTLYERAQAIYMFILQSAEEYHDHSLPLALLKLWQKEIMHDGLERHVRIPDDSEMRELLSTKRISCLETIQNDPDGIHLLNRILKTYWSLNIDNSISLSTVETGRYESELERIYSIHNQLMEGVK